MKYKDLDYMVTLIEPGMWKWEFQIGNVAKTGKIRTNLKGLAERRAEAKIDLFLKEAARIDVARAAWGG